MSSNFCKKVGKFAKSKLLDFLDPNTQSLKLKVKSLYTSIRCDDSIPASRTALLQTQLARTVSQGWPNDFGKRLFVTSEWSMETRPNLWKFTGQGLRKFREISVVLWFPVAL